ncbi:MAG: acyl-CoA thioesterase II [Weeksellaceae bacterium]|nr:acyl-CoA thioesterase II [Weeksellaceae bacterium]
MQEISKLIELLTMEQKDQWTFIGTSEPIGSAHVFGGQVLAQGLYAMSSTVPEDRYCNSLHSYFILPGDLHQPIHFEVENIRDGGSFSTRRVLAKQQDKTIFLMSASFQGREDGYRHQIPMPQVPPPEELYSWDDMYRELKGFLPKNFEQFLAVERPVSFKPTIINNPMERKKLEPVQQVWFKVKGQFEQEPHLNRSILAYISDYNILTTALHPHADTAHFANTQVATIDHSMWFYGQAELSDWLLYSIDSPVTGGARGFTRGHIFNRSGQLVASVAQEGLIRPLNK